MWLVILDLNPFIDGTPSSKSFCALWFHHRVPSSSDALPLTIGGRALIGAKTMPFRD
jgi:hypothetical protein